MSIDFSDQGMDPQNDHIMESFNKWASNLTDKYNNEEMEHVPDTVAMLAGLNIAARRVAFLSRRHMLTKTQALTIFTNMLDEHVLVQQASA